MFQINGASVVLKEEIHKEQLIMNLRTSRLQSAINHVALYEMCQIKITCCLPKNKREVFQYFHLVK
jgi:hypothetical protein